MSWQDEQIKQMKGIIEKLHKTVYHQHETIEKLKMEVNSGVKLLWAMASEAGGKVEIPNDMMSKMNKMNNNCALHMTYDPNRQVTIFETVDPAVAKKQKESKGQVFITQNDQDQQTH